jgi:hypothetical protein
VRTRRRPREVGATHMDDPRLHWSTGGTFACGSLTQLVGAGSVSNPFTDGAATVHERKSSVGSPRSPSKSPARRRVRHGGRRPADST